MARGESKTRAADEGTTAKHGDSPTNRDAAAESPHRGRVGGAPPMGGVRDVRDGRVGTLLGCIGGQVRFRLRMLPPLSADVGAVAPRHGDTPSPVGGKP